MQETKRGVFKLQRHGELLEVVTVAELCQEGTLRDHIDIMYNMGSCPISGAPSCEGQGLPSRAPSECAFPVMDQVRACLHTCKGCLVSRSCQESICTLSVVWELRKLCRFLGRSSTDSVGKPCVSMCCMSGFGKSFEAGNVFKAE
jgi:hypothetical protein